MVQLFNTFLLILMLQEFGALWKTLHVRSEQIFQTICTSFWNKEETMCRAESQNGEDLGTVFTEYKGFPH